MSYSYCQPNQRLPTCGNGNCPQTAAPVISFPNENANLQASAVLSDDRLAHLQEVTIVSATYYQHNGSFFLFVGDTDRIAYTANPRFPLSDLFVFRLRKYPYVGNTFNADGTVPYQSSGFAIREGDFLMIENVGVQRIVTQTGDPNPYNVPFVTVPMKYAINDFASYGSQSPSNVRIVSDGFDPSIPSDSQPFVKTDGSKAYYIQFTRTGQNWCLLPGSEPAPCFMKTTAFKGDGARFVFLPPAWHNTMVIGKNLPNTYGGQQDLVRHVDRPQNVTDRLNANLQH